MAKPSKKQPATTKGKPTPSRAGKKKPPFHIRRAAKATPAAIRRAKMMQSDLHEVVAYARKLEARCNKLEHQLAAAKKKATKKKAK